MKTIFLPLLSAIFVSAPLMLMAKDDNWSYTGHSAPQHWASLSPDYILCNGKNQSPVNISPSEARHSTKRGLKFNYGRLEPIVISNTGKQLQIDVTSGAGINIDGIDFELKHLSFHTPSEHTYNNQPFPMEIQFAHQSKDGQLAYVSLMVAMGKSDRTLKKLQQQLPMKAGKSKPLAPNALRNFEKKKKVTHYYRYSGSLTYPPCNEGVRWFIMNQPLTISTMHLQQFRQAIKQNNNRPLQALNARVILK
ncbi:MAG: carbonic anhydrase family protein [Cocleimonas sp.]|nr:carbonic anhydrase family protein [Cocleimonas sp.]